ncbi:MAG TPA: hypothetical protein VFQ88_09360 [Nevskiaceae bacterium]|nr:hypothetical protein [Nevskiaceae bacterium]
MQLTLIHRPLAASVTGDVGTTTDVDAPFPVSWFHPDTELATLVCGSAAELWWQTAEARPSALADLATHGVQALILGSDGRRCPQFAQATRAFPGTVWRARASAAALVHALRERAVRRIAAQTVPGVMLRVDGCGVLLQGTSGSGKSSLALELVARGHALIADDAVDLRALGPHCLIASCPASLADLLQAGELGVVHVTRLYGRGAVTARTRLDLVIKLGAAPPSPSAAPVPIAATGRLRGAWDTTPLLGIAVPRLRLRTDVGHTLALWVEAAVAEFRARLAGHHAAETLLNRQRTLMSSLRTSPPAS